MIDLTKSDPSDANQLRFSFDLPMVVFEKGDAEPGKQRRIAGIMSSESRDRQGEIILQRGLDFSDFLANGWFNDNHSKDTDAIVGYPESVRSFSQGQVLPNGMPASTNCTWVEGYMLTGHPRADNIWTLGQALQATGRRLGFSVEGNITRRTGSGGNTIAKAKVRNTAITNCFTGDVRVIGKASAVSRRWYEGPMVEVVLASGQRLTGTPNHPIFTQRGWVTLGRLNEAHDRIGCHRDYLPIGVPVATQNVKHVPPTLEQCFASGQVGGTLEQRRIGKADFHGDGQDGDVDVVTLTGDLAVDLHAAFSQQYGQRVLPASDFETGTFAQLGAVRHLGLRVAYATHRLMGSLGALPALFGGQFALAAQHLLSATARHACAGHHGVNPLAAYAVLAGQMSGVFAGRIAPNNGLGAARRQLLEAGHDPSPATGDSHHGGAVDPIEGSDIGRTLSGSVAFGNIRSLRVFDYSGHVFNLESSVGWYDANGILCHNCPVNTDARLEVLARSLAAIEEAGNEAVSKMMTVGAGVPRGPTTGAGAGAILARQDLEDELHPSGVPDSPVRKKKRTRKSMTDVEAVRWVQRHTHVDAVVARDFVTLTKALVHIGIL